MDELSRTEVAFFVAVLANARADEMKAKNEVTILEDKIAATALGKALTAARDELAAAKTHEGLAKAATVAVAVLHFEGDKGYHSAFKIQEKKVIEYADDEAVAYCIEHEIADALSLNKGKFNAVAAVLDLDFVTKSTRLAAAIKKDLIAFEDPQLAADMKEIAPIVAAVAGITPVVIAATEARRLHATSIETREADDDRLAAEAGVTDEELKAAEIAADAARDAAE